MGVPHMPSEPEVPGKPGTFVAGHERAVIGATRPVRASRLQPAARAPRAFVVAILVVAVLLLGGLVTILLVSGAPA
jgi:hypothetical protein